MGEEAGALAALAPDAVAVEGSTVRPEWAQSLDANSKAANRARITLVLAQMASAVHHTGEVGSAGTVRLIVNAMLAIQVGGIAELLASLKHAKLDVHRAVEVIASTSVISPAATIALGAVRARNFNPRFLIELVDKDMRYALDMSRKPGVKVSTTSAAAGAYSEAIGRGLGDDNINRVAKLYKEEK